MREGGLEGWVCVCVGGRWYGLPLEDFSDIIKFRARLGEVKDLR